LLHVTAGTLFILGLSIGFSLPAILEYAEALTIAKSAIFTILFLCSLIFLSISKLSLGASILHLARNAAWKIDKKVYNTFLLGFFLIFNDNSEVL
jgi:hypothetical protein